MAFDWPCGRCGHRRSMHHPESGECRAVTRLGIPYDGVFIPVDDPVVCDCTCYEECSVHTCHAGCPCRRGETPRDDFEGGL